jgi:hypothetical protein
MERVDCLNKRAEIDLLDNETKKQWEHARKTNAEAEERRLEILAAEKALKLREAGLTKKERVLQNLKEQISKETAEARADRAVRKSRMLQVCVIKQACCPASFESASYVLDQIFIQPRLFSWRNERKRLREKNRQMEKSRRLLLGTVRN